MITYYFFININPKSPNYMQPTSVHRMRREDGRAYTERWNGKEWVDNPNLIAAWGIGGDNPYEATTEEEAMRFIKALSGDDYLKEKLTLTLEDAVANVTDSLRYTITYDPENLVDNVLKSHELLKGEGYEPIKLKNYFNSKESGYRGYNTVWQDKVGNKIEVQYHTEESVRIKEAVHKDYEAYRIENDPEKREALLQKMEGAWDNFTPPDNYTKLPGELKP